MNAWIAYAALAALTAGAAPPSPAPQTPPTPARASQPSLDDRIGALIEAGRCGQAKAEATRGGDQELARQIGDMCGARPSTSPGRGAAGADRRGGGSGGGGRGRGSAGG